MMGRYLLGMLASGQEWAGFLMWAAPSSDHSVWIEIFTAFLMTCGAAISLFITIHLWKILLRTRRETGPIPPENLRHGVWTIIVMVLSAALVFGAYEWGRVEWGARTGAALAIGSFVMAAIAWFTWLAVLVRRDARRDRERREGPDHIPGRG